MFTLGTTYYNCPNHLTSFVEKNLPYVDELIVVDDGSQLPAINYIKPNSKLRLFRVKHDYGFNSHGCRNLIMKSTSSEWNILLDIDRRFMFIDDAFKILNKTSFKKDTLYRFIAHLSYRESHISVNDFLIHREHFFSAGGYDEELIGVRDGDRQYFDQLSHFGKEKVLYGVDILLTRRPSLISKNGILSPKDKPLTQKLHKLLVQRSIIPDPNKPILTFEWEEIT